MHDIRLIRDDPAAFDAAMRKRGVNPEIETLLALDQQRRALLDETQKLQTRRNEATAEFQRANHLMHSNVELGPDIVERIGAPARRIALQQELAGIKSQIPQLESDVRSAERNLNETLAKLPNIPAPDVPEGASEEDNEVEKMEGHYPNFSFKIATHDLLGRSLGLDFETGAAMSGARFTLVRGAAARLSRALGQFMLDRLTGEHGYELVSPPILVRSETMFGTGQLPKFAEDSFQTTDGRWLIPTAEVSLTNIVREQILAEADLPLRFTALTPCFRSEAGAAGRDTRGFIRQHQFDKVEMVSIVTPDASEAEHERMTACAEGILDALGLAYRRMKLCTGDMGFTAARTYDLEVWLPGQGRYREISSCSTCTDFQARRMNARYRPTGEKATRFVHTLNGSGLAVGRTLVAVLENYQREDGSVSVPEALKPYLGGAEVLKPQ